MCKCRDTVKWLRNTIIHKTPAKLFVELASGACPTPLKNLTSLLVIDYGHRWPMGCNLQLTIRDQLTSSLHTGSTLHWAWPLRRYPPEKWRTWGGTGKQSFANIARDAKVSSSWLVLVVATMHYKLGREGEGNFLFLTKQFKLAQRARPIMFN